jgi:hypothetical protein
MNFLHWSYLHINVIYVCDWCSSGYLEPACSIFILFIYLFIYIRNIRSVYSIFNVGLHHTLHSMLNSAQSALRAVVSSVCWLLGFRSQVRRLNKLSASSHADNKNGRALTKHVLLCSATTMFIICFVYKSKCLAYNILYYHWIAPPPPPPPPGNYYHVYLLWCKML